MITNICFKEMLCLVINAKEEGKTFGVSMPFLTCGLLYK